MTEKTDATNIQLSRSALWRIAKYTPIGACQLLDSGLLCNVSTSFLAEYLGEAEWSIVHHTLVRVAYNHPSSTAREGALLALARFANNEGGRGGWAHRALEVMAEKDPEPILRKMAQEELDDCPE